LGTQATIAAGRGAVGFPKSAMNSNTCAPIELTCTERYLEFFFLYKDI
jgi:hypothetical protein